MEPSNEPAGGGEATRAGPDLLNGVDRRQIFATIEMIKADPARASCKFFSTTRWRGGTRSECRIDHYELGGERIAENFTIAADEPIALFGGGAAPNPQMLLFAALASCVMSSFVANASVRGIRLDQLELDVEGELDLRGFLGVEEGMNPGYDELTLVCRVKGDATSKQLQECLEAGTHFSPNFQSLSRAVKVHYRLEA